MKQSSFDMERLGLTLEPILKYNRRDKMKPCSLKKHTILKLTSRSGGLFIYFTSTFAILRKLTA